MANEVEASLLGAGPKLGLDRPMKQSQGCRGRGQSFRGWKRAESE